MCLLVKQGEMCVAEQVLCYFFESQVEYSDTKLVVLAVLSIVVDRMRIAIRDHIPSFAVALPRLWDEFESDNMLRCSVVTLITNIINVSLSLLLRLIKGRSFGFVFVSSHTHTHTHTFNAAFICAVADMCPFDLFCLFCPILMLIYLLLCLVLGRPRTLCAPGMRRISIVCVHVC